MSAKNGISAIVSHLVAEGWVGFHRHLPAGTFRHLWHFI
jgi:hypothetical protein